MQAVEFAKSIELATCNFKLGINNNINCWDAGKLQSSLMNSEAVAVL